MKRALLVVLVACVPAPTKNQAVAQCKPDEHRARSTAAGGARCEDAKHETWKAQVTAATFDGKVVRIAIGPRISIAIASCYAHAQQKIGDHDHVQIELDGHAPVSGELDIADCLTTHVVATVDATFADGTHLRADLDTDLVRR
ncbi:MAG TPA: hypothetical protein VH143_14205 [Kofleriaceae bacterium]|nr:hypothetical protein [Kofleriaceae bacterium]